MRFLLALTFTSFLSLCRAHMVITYPGWRGDNLISNGTSPGQNPDAIGVTYENGTATFPWGMQWIYPCGGLGQTNNRSLWPVTGGALGFQPGWFAGHQYALIYINIGFAGPGEKSAPNMSHPVTPQPFQIVGPSNNEYQGSICLPRITMPPGVTFNVGDNITIQVIEVAQHGAALYSCADVTLARPEDVPEVNMSNCQNTSNMGFNQFFTTANLTSAASMSLNSPSVSILSTTILVSVLFAAFLL